MLFTFDESKLLAELEQRPTLQGLSEKLRKDPSVISRDLKRISEKAPVIEKINGRWTLTELGTSLALWSKKITMEQSEILSREYTLTLATTREFASRILARNLGPLQMNGVKLRILSSEEGVESSLLKGLADIGFDCGRPKDPGVAFKQLIEEQIVTVAGTEYLKKNKIRSLEDLPENSFLHYSRLAPLQSKNLDVSKALVSSNDVAVIRTLLVENHGWGTVPYYAIREELREKRLTVLKGGEIRGYKFGVWWLRGRESLLPKVKIAEDWLSSQAGFLKP